MKKVNKDYISVVRNYSGRLHYERIPIQKSEALINRLVDMAGDERFSLQDMVRYLTDSPLFTYMASPFYENTGGAEFEHPADWAMKSIVDSVGKEKTKMKFLENALKLIEECDYRWNVLKISNDRPDISFWSMAGYESVMKHIGLTKDIALFVYADSIGKSYDGELNFTIVCDGRKVLPYRALVELYDCAEETLDSTMMFDPEESQWDNYMKRVVATANEIIEDKNTYFKKKVIEDGLMMAEKMNQLCMDVEGYYNWLWFERGPVEIEYSGNDNDTESTERLNEANKELHKLYMTGRKLTCAMFLAENLHEWAQYGGEYGGLADIYPQMMNLAPEVLRRIERACDEVPEDVFEESHELGDDECEKRNIALDLRTVAEELREWLGMEPRFPEKDS